MSQAAPQANGPANPSGKYIDGIDPDDPEYIKNLQRPAEVKEDLQQMENRSRVKLVLNSQAFKEELEAVVEEQLENGPYPAGLIALQQITDLLLPNTKGTYGGFARAASVIPINDLRGVESLGFAKGEKLLRCKLASLYRVVDLCGWSHGIFNHISARVGSENEHFLVNPFGMMYAEVTASALVKVDVLGDTVDQGSSHFGVSKPSFALHSAIHQARPDIKCVVHLHNPASVAVSAMKCGLLPVSQEALICGKISYHDYQGVLTDPEERDKLARNLGVHNKIMVVRNNGIVACGETVEEAFHFTFNVMAACESQIKLMPAGLDNIVIPSEEAQEQAFKVTSAGGGGVESTGRKWKVGELEFEALMRTLDNSGYRTGYVFKMPMVKQEKRERSNNEVEIPPSSSSFTYIFDDDFENSKYASPIKAAMERHKKAFKAGWLTTPNAYKKHEVEEIGTTTPKKITKWVPEADSPNRPSGTPIKIENANQFAPQGDNPKELKLKQKSIRKDYYEEKVSAGPQSKILDGISWDEAQKAKDGQLSGAGDQLIIVGAASKGIIQRDHQHNAVVYRQYYAANPFENMSEAEMEAYQREVQRKERGEPEPDMTQPEPEPEPVIEPEPVVERQPEVQTQPEPVRQEIEAAVTKKPGGVNGVPDPHAPASASPGPQRDEALAQLADTVVQAVIRDSLAIVCQGKGQHARTGSDPMHYQLYFFSLLLGNQMLLAYRNQVVLEQLRDEEEQFSSESDSCEESKKIGLGSSNLVENQELCHAGKIDLKESDYHKTQYSKEKNIGTNSNVEGEHRGAGAPSDIVAAEASGAAGAVDGQQSSGASDHTGSFVTVQMNPITLYHGQSESGVMKVKFSIVSSVKRKIMAHAGPSLDTGQIEEIYAAVSEPLVQHFEADCPRLEKSNSAAITNPPLETCHQQIHIREHITSVKESNFVYRPTETKQKGQYHAEVKGEILLPEVDPPAQDTIEIVRPTAIAPTSHLSKRKLSDSKQECKPFLEQTESHPTIQEDLHQVDPPLNSTIEMLRPSLNASLCNKSTLEANGKDPPQGDLDCDKNKPTVDQALTPAQLQVNANKKSNSPGIQEQTIREKEKLASQKRFDATSKQISINPRSQTSQKPQTQTPANINPQLNLPKVNVFTPLILSKLNENQNVMPVAKTLPDLSSNSKSSPKMLVLDSFEDIPFADNENVDENLNSNFQVPKTPKQEEGGQTSKLFKSRKLPPLPLGIRTRYSKSKRKVNKRLNRRCVPLSPVKEELGDSLDEMEEMAAIYEDANDSFEQLLASAEDSLLISSGHSSENSYSKLDLDAFIGAAPLATEDDEDDLDEFFPGESKSPVKEIVQASVSSDPVDLAMGIRSVQSKMNVNDDKKEKLEKINNLSSSSDVSDPESSQSSEDKESSDSSSESNGNYNLEKREMLHLQQTSQAEKTDKEDRKPFQHHSINEAVSIHPSYGSKLQHMKEKCDDRNEQSLDSSNGLTESRQTPNYKSGQQFGGVDSLHISHEPYVKANRLTASNCKNSSEEIESSRLSETKTDASAYHRANENNKDLLWEQPLQTSSPKLRRARTHASVDKMKPQHEREPALYDIPKKNNSGIALKIHKDVKKDKAVHDLLTEDKPKITKDDALEAPCGSLIKCGAQNKRETAIDDASDEDTRSLPHKALGMNKKETAIDDASDEDIKSPPSKVVSQNKKETAIYDDSNEDIRSPPSNVMGQNKKETAIDDDSGEDTRSPPFTAVSLNKNETAIDDDSNEDIRSPPSNVMGQNKKETAIDDDSGEDTRSPSFTAVSLNKKETAIDDDSDEDTRSRPFTAVSLNKKETAIDDSSNEDIRSPLSNVMGQNKKETAIDDDSGEDTRSRPFTAVSLNKKETAIDDDSDEDIRSPPSNVMGQNKKETAIDDDSGEDTRSLPFKAVGLNKKETAIDDDSDEDIRNSQLKAVGQNKKEIAIDNDSEDSKSPPFKIWARNKKETAIDDDSDKDTERPLFKAIGQNKKEITIDDDSDESTRSPPFKVLAQNKKESTQDSITNENVSKFPVSFRDKNKIRDDKENLEHRKPTSEADVEVVLGRQGKESPKLIHLDKYHLRKHDEMMKLSSSRSVFKAPPTPPALVVYPLTTESLPPLPDTTEVPSISDTEGRQRLERQIRQERAQSLRNLNQNQGVMCDNDIQKSPSSIATSEADRSSVGRKRWVPKRDRERRRTLDKKDGDGKSSSRDIRTPTAGQSENNSLFNTSQGSQGLSGSERYGNTLKTEKMNKVISEIKDIQHFQNDQYNQNVEQVICDEFQSRKAEKERGKERKEKEDMYQTGSFDGEHRQDRQEIPRYVNDSPSNTFAKKEDTQDVGNNKNDGRNRKKAKNDKYDDDDRYDENKNNRDARHKIDRHSDADKSFEPEDNNKKTQQSKKETQSKRNRSFGLEGDYNDEDKYNRKVRHARDRGRYHEADYDDEDKYNRKVRHKRDGDRGRYHEPEDDYDDRDKYSRKVRHKKDGDRGRYDEANYDDEDKFNRKDRHKRDRGRGRYSEHEDVYDDGNRYDRKTRYKKDQGQHPVDRSTKDSFTGNRDKTEAKNRKQEGVGKEVEQGYDNRPVHDKRKNQDDKLCNKSSSEPKSESLFQDKFNHPERNVDTQSNVSPQDKKSYTGDNFESKSQVPAIFVTERDESLDSYSQEIESMMEPNVVTVDRFLNSVPDVDRSGSPRLSRRRGGAIASGELKQKKRAHTTRSEPRGDNKNSKGISLTGSNSQMSSLQAAVLTRSNTSLASSTLSRRSRSESPRIFENSPESLPPKPQIDPLTGEPFCFVHPLMAQSVESLRSIGRKQDSLEHSPVNNDRESNRNSKGFSPNSNVHRISQEREQEQSHTDYTPQESNVHSENVKQIESKSQKTWKPKNTKHSFQRTGKSSHCNETPSESPGKLKEKEGSKGAKLKTDVYSKEILPPKDVSDIEDGSSCHEETTQKVIKHHKKEIDLEYEDSRKPRQAVKTSSIMHSKNKKTSMDRPQDTWKPKQRGTSSTAKKYRPEEELSSEEEAYPKRGKRSYEKSPKRLLKDSFDDEPVERWQPGRHSQNRRSVEHTRDDTQKAALEPSKTTKKHIQRDHDKSSEEAFLGTDPADFTVGHEDFKPDQDEPILLPSKNKKGFLSRLSCVGGKSKESITHAEKSKGRIPISRQVDHYEEGEKKKIKKVSKDKDKEEKGLWYFQNDEDLQTSLSNTDTANELPDEKLLKKDKYDKLPDFSGQRYLSTFSDPVSAIEPFLEEKNFSDQDSVNGSLQLWNTGRMTPVLEESSVSSFKSSRKEESEHGLFKSFGKGEQADRVDSKLNFEPGSKREEDNNNNSKYTETNMNKIHSSAFQGIDVEVSPQLKQSKHHSNSGRWKPKSADNQNVSGESRTQEKKEQSKQFTHKQDDIKENFAPISGNVKNNEQGHFTQLYSGPKQPPEIITSDLSPASVEKKVHKNIFGPAHDEVEESFEQSTSFEPSASFDSADGFVRQKPRAFSFDETYIERVENPVIDLGFVQKAAMGTKRRVSIASTESSSLKGIRSRSNSVTSNPLTYEPWRAKAKQRSRSMSISELMTARGAPRNSHHPSRSRSRSFSEIPHAYNSTVANSLARRRSRTQTPQELSPRMYQPRPRSRSRGSLGDTSLGCGAAPINHPTTGSLPSNTGACLADGSWYTSSEETDNDSSDNDGYLAAAQVKRSESERQPARMVEDPERKNVERSKSDRRQQLIEQNPTSPSKSDTLRSTDSASGGETLEERSSKEGSPTKEHPSPTKEKKKKKKFRIPSFSKKKNKESKESAI